MARDNRLKLRAAAAEDVEVLSALLQDGLVAASDLHYQKSENSFVMVINRFCWEQDKDIASDRQLNRCLCGLKVGYVKQVSKRGILAGANEFYNLLSISYVEAKENKDALSRLTFTFSDGYGIRLAIDRIALIMQDIAAPHPGLARPHHNKG